MRIHQMTATLVSRDAVSNDVLEIDRRLKAWGFQTSIFAENIDPLMASYGVSDAGYTRYLDDPTDVLLFHYSIYSPNLQLYQQSRNRKIVIYHNITPGEYFADYDPVLAALCNNGRQALPQLAGCELALADSDYNRQELVTAGLPESLTAVRPLFMRLDVLDNAARNSSLYDQIKQRGEPNLLYVGRLAPNKGCEELLKILFYYRTCIAPRAHLWLVGSQALTKYVAALRQLVARLGLQDAVTFADQAWEGTLRTYYEACDVFLFASRHEGLGAPLVESMGFGLPILAYAAAAVPETLGEAGVLYHDWRYADICEMLHLLVSDQGLRQQVIRRERQRREDFAPARIEAQLRACLAQIGVL
jgi:glycosyltransferase involved in cell wall biosynthesis